MCWFFKKEKKKSIDDFITFDLKDKEITAKFILDNKEVSLDVVAVTDRDPCSLTIVCDKYNNIWTQANSGISSTENIEDIYINIKDENDVLNFYRNNGTGYFIEYLVITDMIKFEVSEDNTLKITPLNEYREISQIISIRDIINNELFKKRKPYFLIEDLDEYDDFVESGQSIEEFCSEKIRDVLDDNKLMPAFSIFVDKIGYRMENYDLMLSLIDTLKNKSVLYIAFKDYFMKKKEDKK